jgi:predicted nucleic acid-binding Zn ribbon protein
MDFSFNNFNHFLYNMLPQVVGHPLLPTIIKKFYPHKPCSYCFNAYHEENNCPNLRAVLHLRDKLDQIKAARSTPTHFFHTYTPHKLCSYCSNPYHSDNNCPSCRQVSNYSYEQMNTNFSSPGLETNSSFYNPD